MSENDELDRAAWFAVAMNAAASLEDAANCLPDSDAKRTAQTAAEFTRKRANELWSGRIVAVIHARV